MRFKIDKYYFKDLSLKIIILYCIGFSNTNIGLAEGKVQSNLKNSTGLEWIQVKQNKSKSLLGLDNIENLIIENNKELKIMKIRIEEARFLLRSEISAWYPNFNISSAGLPQYLAGNTSNKFSTNTSNSQTKSSLKATIKWDVINPSRVPQIAKAKDNFENARIAYSIKSRDLILAAKLELINLQKSIQDIKVARDSLKTSEILLKDSNTRFKNGLSAKFDVLEAQTQFSKDKQFLAEQLGKRKINESKLAQLLNLQLEEIKNIEINPRIIGLWNLSLTESVSYGYKYRKEIAKLLNQISINQNNAKLALAKNQPKVSIYNTLEGYISKGELGVASPRGDNEVNSYNNTIGIKLDWPLYDGGRSKSKYYAEKEKIKESKVEIDLKKSEIRKEIEEIFFNLDVSRQNMINSASTIKSARESLRLSHLRLKSGISTQREVVNNQRDLTQAEVNHIKSIADYNQNLIKLQRQTGVKELEACSDSSTYKNKIKNSDPHDLRKDQGFDSLPLNTESCPELL